MTMFQVTFFLSIYPLS